MAADRHQPLRCPRSPPTSVAPEPRGWVSWVTTTDHKRIGIMYLVTTFVFFLLGGVEALLIRLQLGAPDNTLLDAADVQPAVHDARDDDGLPVRRADHGRLRQLLRAADDRRARHGVPEAQRAVVLAAARRRHRLLRLAVLRAAGGGLDDRTRRCRDDAYSRDGGVDAWIFLIHLTGSRSLLGAINFYATIANMRAPGMGWGRLPLFVWTILVYAILLILALPVIAGGGDAAADRPPLRDALLRPEPGRRPAAVAAPLLVLRPPRGLHHDPAGLRDHLRGPAGLRAQADLRLQGDRGGDGRSSRSCRCSCGRTTCSRRRARRSCSSSS